MSDTRSALTMPSRNEVEGFAERTRKNLEYVISAHEEGADVHVVTQLVLSLLGLIVFPFERLDRSLWRADLSDLAEAGWPRWIETHDSYHPKTLGDLVRVLRHAVAHGNVSFSSEDRHLPDVVIRFVNIAPGGRRQWLGEIRGDDLLEFCRRYLEYMYEAVA